MGLSKNEKGNGNSFIKRLIGNSKFKTWFVYSVLFSFLMLFIVTIFYCAHRSFVWQDDGLKQHYVILKSFNEMIREFLKNPSLGLSQYSFSLGLGGDIIGQYSYYILGDPFAYLSLLFPMKYLKIAYMFLVALRMYCVGLAFIVFGNYKGLKQKNILVGALIYTFSAFVLFAGVRHPYFLNPVILFPLLLMAVDILFKKNKIVPLLVLTFVSLVSNYYFFYMLTVLIGIYTLLKYFFEYKERGFKFLFRIICKIILAYLIATFMASVIFLPSLYAFLNSARLDGNSYGLYRFSHYQKLLSGLVTSEANPWNIYGVSSIILLMLPMLFKNRKKYKVLFGYFVVMIIILLFSIFGSLMNGFSFPSNRWLFGFSFLLSYIIALFFDFDFKYTKEDIKLMITSIVVYFALIVLTNYEFSKELVIAILFSLIMLLVIIYNKNLRKFKINAGHLMIILIVFNLASLIFYTYSIDGKKKYIKEFIEYSSVTKAYNTMRGKIKNYGDATREIKKDNSFYRISSYPNNIYNNYMYFGTKGINSFLSVGNKYDATLSMDLNNREYFTSIYIKEFDNRTKITTLLNAKYFIVDKENISYVPYGYTLYKQIGDTCIYINNNFLGLGTFYDSYIDLNTYSKLSPLDKENMLLDSVVLNDKVSGYSINKGKYFSSLENIDYEIIDDNNILKNNKVILKSKNQSLTLKLDELKKDSEIYLEINNIKYRPYSKKELMNIELSKKHSSIDKMVFFNKYKDYYLNDNYKVKVGMGNIKKTEQSLNSKTSPYYFENKEMLFNLTANQSGTDEIKITFDKRGVYSFSDIKVYAVNMNDYKAQVAKLNETKFNVESIDNDNIYGNISNKSDGILQIAVPYSDGWEVYVDGNKTEVLNVNTAFIGVPLKAGNHKIHFEYKTPYLKLGFIFSIIGFLSFFIVLYYEKYTKTNNFIKKSDNL